MSPSLRELWLHRRSDEALAALVAQGDERAFAALVDRHRSLLLSLAARTVGRDRAEDVLQQALLNAWSALRSGTEVTHVRGWLVQIVRHTAWKSGRGRECSELPESIADAATLAGSFELKASLKELVGHVKELPAHQREALVQTVLEGRSASEVATHLSVTEGAVRQLVYRARTRLQHAMLTILPAPLLSWLARRGEGENDAATNAAAGSGAAAGAMGIAKLAAVALTIGAAGLGVKAGLANAGRDPDRTAAAAAAVLDGSAQGGRGNASSASGPLRPLTSTNAPLRSGSTQKPFGALRQSGSAGSPGSPQTAPLGGSAAASTAAGSTAADGTARSGEAAPAGEAPTTGSSSGPSEVPATSVPAEGEAAREVTPSEAAPAESPEAQPPSGESSTEAAP